MLDKLNEPIEWVQRSLQLLLYTFNDKITRDTITNAYNAYLNGEHVAGIFEELCVETKRPRDHLANIPDVQVAADYLLPLFGEGQVRVEPLVVALEQAVDDVHRLVCQTGVAQILHLELHQRLIVVVRGRKTVQKLREEGRSAAPRCRNEYPLDAFALFRSAT